MRIIDEDFINDLNNLIEECAHDGAEYDSNYHSNTYAMIDAIKKILADLELDKEYHVVEYDKMVRNQYWSPVYIAKK